MSEEKDALNDIAEGLKGLRCLLAMIPFLGIFFMILWIVFF